MDGELVGLPLVLPELQATHKVEPPESSEVLASSEQQTAAPASLASSTRSLNWSDQETTIVLNLRFKEKELSVRFASQREKKDEDDNWEKVAKELGTRDSAQCRDRLKTLVKKYKKLTQDIYTATGNRRAPRYPAYWSLLVDCLAPFPGLRGLTVGGSHVATPEGAGGALREQGAAQPPRKKQRGPDSTKKTSSQAPVARVCDSIERLIDMISPRPTTSESSSQDDILSLRADISRVNTQIESLATIVSKLAEKHQAQ
ncbi:hypothetical protein DVH05_002523 [Phytophthora capsici]|nr:hypothetical protein DVH05_002523 [Phytophthora capsici]